MPSISVVVPSTKASQPPQGFEPTTLHSPRQVTKENIDNTIESLENDEQKDFIRACLQPDPELRPTARQLLFLPVMFEVPSLKLLAAHAVVNDPSEWP